MFLNTKKKKKPNEAFLLAFSFLSNPHSGACLSLPLPVLLLFWAVDTPPALPLECKDNEICKQKAYLSDGGLLAARSFQLMGSQATWVGHGWFVSSWQQTVFATWCIHGQCQLLSKAVQVFLQLNSVFCDWATVLGNVAKQKGPPLCSVISHI